MTRLSCDDPATKTYRAGPRARAGGRVRPYVGAAPARADPHPAGGRAPVFGGPTGGPT